MKNPHAKDGTGASQWLARRPEVPTQNAPSTQPDAADAVAVFAPWCGATERALRIRVHRARDTATARATRCRHGAAREIFWLAARSAELRVFARASEDELRETIDNLARLFMVGGWIERTETPDGD